MSGSNTPLRHVAVLGAAGGLGSAILDTCRRAGITFTAIVRSRPERIANVPDGSRAVVVPDLADRRVLAGALRGADALLTATGVTRTSQDRSALLSTNLESLEAAMNDAGVERIVIVNTLIAAAPGEKPSFMTRLFTWVPGKTGRGASDLQAVPVALGEGALASVRWTLVRAATNSKGADVEPVASPDWSSKRNSMLPVSYPRMARWMLDEAARCEFVRGAPLVSKPR